MAGIIRYANGIAAVDCMMAGYPELIAAFVVPGDPPAVIETGPATVVDTLLDGLAELGIGRNDPVSFAGTHIHLDHAGGAGDVTRVMPKATIAVHTIGAKHMVDPSKLMASAYRVFGERLDRLFGPLSPVPADRLRAIDEGDRIELGGGRFLTVIYAPGHARHHVAFQDSQTGALFVGDSMGVYLPEAGILRPATPPPEFELDLALQTFDRYRELDPPEIYLSHFGPAPAGRDLLGEARRKLIEYAHIIRDAMKTSHDLDFLAERLEDATQDEYAEVNAKPWLSERFDALNAFRSAAGGYLRYFEQHPDAEIPPA